MEVVAVVGLDLAKIVCQVHEVTGAGAVGFRKQLRRAQVLSFLEALPACLIGIEACASAHYWERELFTLGATRCG